MEEGWRGGEIICWYWDAQHSQSPICLQWARQDCRNKYWRYHIERNKCNFYKNTSNIKLMLRQLNSSRCVLMISHVHVKRTSRILPRSSLSLQRKWQGKTLRWSVTRPNGFQCRGELWVVGGPYLCSVTIQLGSRGRSWFGEVCFYIIHKIK